MKNGWGILVSQISQISQIFLFRGFILLFLHLPQIALIYADLFSRRYILSQIAQITQIFYLRRFKN